MEDGELVALVFEEPHRRVDLELVPVRRRQRVPAADVAVGDAVPEDEYAAALVGRLVGGVRVQLGPYGGRDHHQSTASSISSPLQNGAERYFQPPSARTATTTEPSGSSSAIRRATCTTAPDETPEHLVQTICIDIVGVD